MNVLRSSLALLMMNVLSAGLSAVYVTMAGRMLGPSEYGSFAALVALTGLILLIFASIESGVTKLVAEYLSKDAPGRAVTLVRITARRSGQAMALVSLLLLPFLPAASRALNLGHPSELFVFVVYVAVWLFASILRGVQRGQSRFYELGMSLVLESAVRVLFGLGAIYVGFGAAGGMAGYVAGMAACLALAYVQTRSLWQATPEPAEPERLLSLSGNLFFLYAYPMVVTTLDVIVAKRSLSAVDAGIYGACGTLARLILVGGTPFLHVVFSRVSALRGAGQPVLGLVVKTVLAMSVTLLLSYLVPGFFGEQLLRLAFGDAFNASADPLRILWITVGLLLIQHMIALALAAADRTRGTWSLIVPCVVHVALLARHHADATQVAQAGLVAVVVGLFPLGYIAFRSAPGVDEARPQS